jgi:hypothetical protein
MSLGLSEQVEKALDLAGKALQGEAVVDYEALDREIRRVEGEARERFQELLREEYRALVEKLQAGSALDEKERQALELLLVGEAEYYLKEENDFESWKRELGRLAEEMEGLRDSGLDSVDALMHLQALCRDARGVLPDVAYYLRQKERVQRFKAGTEGAIKPEDGKFLADFLREMMDSDEI